MAVQQLVAPEHELGIPVPQIPRRTRTRSVLALIRPEHWPKNAVIVPFVLIALPSWTPRAAVQIAWIILAFTIASATVYILNDVQDRHRDRLHPVKRLRPVACGDVPVGIAYACAAGALALLSLVIAVGVTLLDAPAQAIWPIAGYLIVNIAYSAWLKHVPLIDVFLVASGFVLRLLAGVLAISASLSSWLVLSIFCICLLFGIGKRRHELVVLGSSSQQHRPSLAAYSVQLLDYLALLSAGIGLMSFMSYLTTAAVVDTFGRLTLTLSAPFMLFATFRYLQLIVVHRTGGNPVRLLVRDRLLVVNCAIWSAGLLVAYLAA
ncbi:UbiA prenyltransferase family protein [Micromonospora sp. NPDC049374]|uniref:UbiA prenyltransferase family protein n=1 Tax=Micromonospora sp. NPDC049374 TaxID=3154352 RepID=UPI00343B33CB